MGAESYTVGKGKLLLKLSGENAYRDFGNAPEFKVNVEIEKIEHFKSTEGMKIKDAEIPTQQKATISFSLDELTPENVMFFSMAKTPTSVVQASGNVLDQVVTAVLDQWVALEKSKLSNVVVTNSAGTTTYVLNTDYQLNTEEGLVMALSTGAIAEAQSLKVDYDHAAETRKRVDAATRTFIEGDLLFIGNPPKGRKVTIKGWATIFPGGEVSLIGDEITAMQFTGEFLSKSTYKGLFEWQDRGVVA